MLPLPGLGLQKVGLLEPKILKGPEAVAQTSEVTSIPPLLLLILLREYDEAGSGYDKRSWTTEAWSQLPFAEAMLIERKQEEPSPLHRPVRQNLTNLVARQSRE